MDPSAGRRRRQRGHKEEGGEVMRPRRGRRMKGAGRAHSSQRTATRTLVAFGAVVAQDLRDPDGAVRPLLRRAAVRMIGSRRGVVRHLGATYLRRDPPAPEELAAGASRPARITGSCEPRQLPPARSARESETETKEADLEADESSGDATRPGDAEPRPEGDPPV